MVSSSNPFTILTLDGGGMRGFYTASVLRALADRFRQERGAASDQVLDVGSGFDLVVGTSTGALLAAGIVAGVPLEQICAVFRRTGPKIFSRPIPAPGWFPDWRKLWWLMRRARRPAARQAELQRALKVLLGDETFSQVYERRSIGLCVTATNLQTHKPRVFKTPHNPQKNLDNDLEVCNACMASSAAPVYLPISVTPGAAGGRHYFSDGGLWASNPVMVGLLEGLTMAAPGQPIVMLSVGTCLPRSGLVPPKRLAVGACYWAADVRLFQLAMASQASAAQHAVTLLAESLRKAGQDIAIMRCAETEASPEQTRLLQLDSASARALDLMVTLGQEDATMTYRWTQTPSSSKGKLLKMIFDRMSEISTADHQARKRT